MNTGSSRKKKPTISGVFTGNNMENKKFQRGLVLNHENMSLKNPYRHLAQHPQRIR